MTVVAVSSDDLIARLDRNLHADDDGFLADIEVAEAADQPHAVQLSGLLLEPANEQHLAVGVKLLLLVEIRHLRRRFDGRPAHGGGLSRGSIAGNGHFAPRGGALCRRGGYFPNSRNRRRAEADGDKRGRGSLGREIGRKNRFRKLPLSAVQRDQGRLRRRVSSRGSA